MNDLLVLRVLIYFVVKPLYVVGKCGSWYFIKIELQNYFGEMF